MQKICSTCGISKEESEFRGVRHKCRECDRAYTREYMANQRKSNPEWVKAIKKASDIKHREDRRQKAHARYEKTKSVVLAKAAEYRDKNREKINAWFREYYQTHNALRRAKDAKHYAGNREQILAQRKEYRNEHRAEIRQRNYARKRALAYSKQDFSQSDWDACLEYWGYSCAVCGREAGEGVTICADHWIPLKRGGITHKSNLVPLCHGIGGCNNNKSAREPHKWIIERLGNERGEARFQEIEAYLSSR